MISLLASAYLLFSASATVLPDSAAYAKGRDAEIHRQWAEAAAAFDSAAGTKGELQGHARAKAAVCRAKADPSERNLAALRTIAGDPGAPWGLMAAASLADILADAKDYAGAREALGPVLNLRLKPWWWSDFAWRHADYAWNDPKLKPEAFNYYRELLTPDRYQPRRLDAARRLADAPEAEDQLLAAWRLLCIGEADDAGKVLKRLTPLGEAYKKLAVLAERIPAATPQKGKKKTTPSEKEKVFDQACKETPEILAVLPESDWIRLWMAYCVRRHLTETGASRSIRVWELLERRYPKSRETIESAWWLGKYFDGADKDDSALRFYEWLPQHAPQYVQSDTALLMAGIIHDRKKEPKKARTAWLRVADEYEGKSTLWWEALYRAGTSFEQHKDKTRATECYRRALKNGVGRYFAHAALDRLASLVPGAPEAGIALKNGADNLRAFRLAPASSSSAADQAYARLAYFGGNGWFEAEWEALWLLENAKSDADKATILKTMAASGVCSAAMTFTDQGIAPGLTEADKLAIHFPAPHWDRIKEVAKANNLDPYLVLSVARQESTFRPALVSSAGAKGILQVMPSTAKWMLTKESSLTADHADHLDSPAYCLEMGGCYLRRMLDTYDGNVMLAVAAYNAGPGNVAKWRKAVSPANPCAFTDAIPFRETRGYVRAVLGNYAAYKSLYKSGE